MTARTMFLNHSATMGGAEFCLLDIATSLRGSSVVVLLQDGPFRERLQASGVTVKVIDAGAIHHVRRESRLPSTAALRSLWRAAGEVAEFAVDFDVIHANSQKALMVGSVAARRSGTPLVWHLHDIIDPPAFSRLNIFADIFLANHVADRVIAVSRATADAFVRNGGRADRVHVVYNGIDAAPYDSPVDTHAGLRSSLGLSNVPVVGCFSRLAEWKGQHVLLDAVATLPEVHVLLVGGALFGEDAYEQTLRTMVVDRGMQHRVHFLGQRPDVAALMQCVDLVVHPSTSPEPFARTLIESMLSRRPPIASACGGVPELIESGKNGYLFPPSDSLALREIIQRLLSNPVELSTVALAATKHARTHFSKSAFVDATTAHLNAAAASRVMPNLSGRLAEAGR